MTAVCGSKPRLLLAGMHDGSCCLALSSRQGGLSATPSSKHVKKLPLKAGGGACIALSVGQVSAYPTRDHKGPRPYFPARNISKLLAAGLATVSTNGAAKKITIRAAVVSMIEVATLGEGLM